MAGKKKYDYNVEDIVSMFKSGMSYEDIGSKYGMGGANVGHILNKLGYTRRKGGVVASTIPKHEFQVEPEKQRDAEIESIAAKNAVNACLVVADREVRLQGTVGEYMVFGKGKTVTIYVGGDAVQLSFENLPAFIDELKAIARNMGGLEPGCEMW